MCVLIVGKAAADANAAAWAAYYSQYQQQPQAPMTQAGGAPGNTQANGQGSYHLLRSLPAACGFLLGVWFARNPNGEGPTSICPLGSFA